MGKDYNTFFIITIYLIRSAGSCLVDRRGSTDQTQRSASGDVPVNLTWPGTSDQDTEIIIYTFIFAKNLLNGHSGAVGAIAMWPVVPEPEPLHERAKVPARVKGRPRDRRLVITHRITVQVFYIGMDLSNSEICNSIKYLIIPWNLKIHLNKICRSPYSRVTSLNQQ